MNCKSKDITGIFALVAAIAVALLLTGCATQKSVIERHYHYSEVDTAAVQAQVDRRMSGWREAMVKDISVTVQSQLTEQSSQEQQRERITESITTWVDSLGREMRQEQRTTERDISRQQQLREERMQREWEECLQRVTDSLNEVWQMNFNRFQAHWAQADSTAQVQQAAVQEDARPWWKRWRDAVWWLLLGAAVVIVVVAIKKFMDLKK